MASPTPATAPAGAVPRDSVVIRFAGDSGDGMQLTGTQFTMETALFGNDLATFPDYPAEIRAPVGTTFGVSAFQIHFGAVDIMTAGDDLDVLVALNPAALTVNVEDLRVGGLIVVDEGAFTKRNIAKAGYDADPLEGDALSPFQVLKIDISKRTLEAVAKFGLGQKEALRSRNLWTLGLMLWMFGRDKTATAEWLRAKFAKRPDVADANLAALNAGHAFGETAEMSSSVVGYTVAKVDVPPGEYRTVTGTEALAWGLVAGTKAAGLSLFFGSYPITPASPLLHVLANLKHYGVVTFQAEDEIAAVCSAIGASYAGALGITSSSGPGVALKGEALGLAVATEYPLILVNSQRAGPSTGMPTKTEQSDLFQALYGRNADTPMPVIACATPGDCFEVGIEAVRLATKFMTPVTILTDGYLSNAAEPWHIPDTSGLPEFPVTFRTDPADFQPYQRDPETLARPWVRPGTPGLEHRIGGIERQDGTGNISYDANNHQHMTDLRHRKVAGIADHIPLQDVALGDDQGTVAVVAWGSTYGAVHQAVHLLRDDGHAVSHIHIRYLHPFPKNLGDLLARFDHVLVPEMNMGQLVTVLRSTYLLPAEGLNKVQGKPFRITEIVNAVRTKLGVSA